MQHGLPPMFTLECKCWHMWLWGIDCEVMMPGPNRVEHVPSLLSNVDDVDSFIKPTCLGFANFNAHGVLLYINFEIADLNARTWIHGIFEPRSRIGFSQHSPPRDEDAGPQGCPFSSTRYERCHALQFGWGYRMLFGRQAAATAANALYHLSIRLPFRKINMYAVCQPHRFQTRDGVAYGTETLCFRKVCDEGCDDSFIGQAHVFLEAEGNAETKVILPWLSVLSPGRLSDHIVRVAMHLLHDVHPRALDPVVGERSCTVC